MVKLKSTLMAVLLMMTGVVFGQKFEDVVAKFNEGADDINKGEFITAISHLQEVLAMAETVGSEADDLVTKTKEQIPLLNYQIAIGYMKQKDYANAIPYLERTVDLATAYGNNEEYKSKAEKYLPQLLTGVATQKLKSEEVDEALQLFLDAAKYAPDYPKAYLGAGLAYKIKFEEEEMISALTKAIDLAKAQNDTKTVQDAREALGGYFVDMGNDERENMDPVEEDFTYVTEAYNRALEYHPSNPDAHYWLAVIDSRMENYDSAIKHLNEALKSETIDIKLAAINYELGNAYFEKAELDLACESYKKALVDQFEEKARKKMEKIPGCE